MPFTRQRPDGTNETHRTTLPAESSSRQTGSPQTLSNPVKLSSLSRFLRKKPARNSAAVLAAAAASMGLCQPAQVEARNTARTHAAPAPTPAALRGTWAWTNGSQTYLRVRPSALTPPVAKVGLHSQLFVWGKFNGWYRVETADHIYGWVYNSYLNLRDAQKVAALSHHKARVASDRTGHQTMYGSKSLLVHYYAQYGAVGAAKGLRKEGVLLASLAHKHAPAGNSHKVATNPRLARLHGAHNRFAARPNTDAGSRTAGRVVTSRTNDPADLAPDASFNDVGSVGLAPTPPVENHAEYGDSRYSVPAAGTADTVESAPAVPGGVAELSAPPVPAAESGRTAALHPPRLSRHDRAHANRAAAFRAAALRRNAARVASAAHPSAHQQRLAERQAQARRYAQAYQLAHQAHLWRIAQRRNALRRRMGTVAMAPPRLSPPDLRPLSPSELLKARNQYLTAQGKPAAHSGSGFVTPSSYSGEPVTVPEAGSLLLVSYVKPFAARARAGHSRGGSPRDYAAYAMRRHSNGFGDGLAQQALTYRGMPYIHGASSPRHGFDCSGLIFFLLRERGYNAPRTASELSSFGQGVSRGSLKKGDIVFFANTYKRGVSHVGVYLGNGTFVHAANPSKGVRVDSLFSGYYANKYWGARRIK